MIFAAPVMTGAGPAKTAFGRYFLQAEGPLGKKVGRLLQIVFFRKNRGFWQLRFGLLWVKIIKIYRTKNTLK